MWYEDVWCVHVTTHERVKLVYEHDQGITGGDVVRLMPTTPEISILPLIAEASIQRVA